MDKNIVFTKLGTVKCDSFEYTYEDFLRIMSEAISRSVDSNSVQYNEEDDTYTIVYNSHLYRVQHGKDKLGQSSNQKDIINLLNKLIDLTKKQEKKSKEEEEAKEELELIIENGKRGIFNSDDDKRKYVTFLKSELPNVKDPNKPVKPWRIREICSYLEAPADLASLFILASFDLLGPELALFLFVKIIYDGIVGISNVISGRSIGTLSSLIVMPTYYGIHSIKSLVKKNALKKKMKKQIKALEESLAYSDTKGTLESIKEEVDQVVEEKESSKKMEHSVKVISSEFKSLKDRILEIVDQEKKEEFSRDLLGIINNYKSKINEENGDSLVIRKGVLDQIVSLRYLVDRTIREEEEKQNLDEEFQRMMDEIDALSTRKMGR